MEAVNHHQDEERRLEGEEAGHEGGKGMDGEGEVFVATGSREVRKRPAAELSMKMLQLELYNVEMEMLRAQAHAHAQAQAQAYAFPNSNPDQM